MGGREGERGEGERGGRERGRGRVCVGGEQGKVDGKTGKVSGEHSKRYTIKRRVDPTLQSAAIYTYARQPHVQIVVIQPVVRCIRHLVLPICSLSCLPDAICLSQRLGFFLAYCSVTCSPNDCHVIHEWSREVTC